jgi:HAD superfamily hydrolase (TIGR01450 family)
MPPVGDPPATIERVNDRQDPDRPVEWHRIETVLCDLDGVVWLAHRPIPGAVEAIAQLRADGRRVVFVTNNSAARLADHESSLAAIGIPAVGDVASSAMAAAALVGPGQRALVTGGPGVTEALEQRGVHVVGNDGTVESHGFDAVVVGLDRRFDYDRLHVAAAAVRAGARLIGTNTDSTYPTPSGLRPGGGSILAAIATASDTAAVVGGKPHRPMADLVSAMVSTPQRSFDPRCTVVVGDRLETDGLFAQRLGASFALVRSGVTPAGAAVPSEIGVDLDATDLAAVAARISLRSSQRQ